MSPLQRFWFFLLWIWYGTESLFKTCFDRFVPTSLRKLKDISGEIALVTGGGAGIGRLLAIELAKRHATVVIWDVNKHTNEETARMIRAINGNVHAYTVDVSKPKEVYATADKVRWDVGHVTMLVNNAGIAHYKPVLECSDKLIQKMVDVNALSHFWLYKTFLPPMQAANRGHIVTVAGVAAYFPTRHMGAYTSSLCATVGIHESMQMDLMFAGSTGIKMSLVSPGLVATNMIIDRINFGDADILSPQEAADAIIEGILLNRPVICVPQWVFFFTVMKSFIPLKYLVRTLRVRKIDDPLSTRRHLMREHSASSMNDTSSDIDTEATKGD